MLRRLGNKSKIAKELYLHFPKHKVRYLPFFGGGGDYFNMPQAQYTIANDKDEDVFNLFQVVKNNFDDFLFLFEITPMSEQLFYHWVEHEESEPIRKALRFLFLSSFSYLGKNGTFMLIHSNCTYKQKLQHLIKKCSEYFRNTMFRNKDFRDFFNDIYVTEAHIPISKRFAYLDPPYVGTTNNYKEGFKENDSIDLIDTVNETGIRYAYSEFETDFTKELAKTYNLNIYRIGERRTLGNRNTEIIMTNYKSPAVKKNDLFSSVGAAIF